MDSIASVETQRGLISPDAGDSYYSAHVLHGDTSQNCEPCSPSLSLFLPLAPRQVQHAPSLFSSCAACCSLYTTPSPERGERENGREDGEGGAPERGGAERREGAGESLCQRWSEVELGWRGATGALGRLFAFQLPPHYINTHWCLWLDAHTLLAHACTIHTLRVTCIGSQRARERGERAL